jgi:hypothetical protein
VLQGGAATPEAMKDIRDRPVTFSIADSLDAVRNPVRDLVGHFDFVIIDMGP